MGRGNIRPKDNCIALFYVDYDYLNEYRCDHMDTPDSVVLRDIGAAELSSGHWSIDEDLSRQNYEDFIENLKSDFSKRFSSFEPPFDKNTYLNRDQQLILENRTCAIVAEDNEWSVAIMLVLKDDAFENLVQRFKNTYTEGLRTALFNQFDTLGVYGGPWTHGTISKGDD